GSTSIVVVPGAMVIQLASNILPQLVVRGGSINIKAGLTAGLENSRVLATAMAERTISLARKNSTLRRASNSWNVDIPGNPLKRSRQYQIRTRPKKTPVNKWGNPNDVEITNQNINSKNKIIHLFFPITVPLFPESILHRTY